LQEPKEFQTLPFGSTNLRGPQTAANDSPSFPRAFPGPTCTTHETPKQIRNRALGPLAVAHPKYLQP
jgi:hypothetical protein